MSRPHCIDVHHHLALRSGRRSEGTDELQNRDEDLECVVDGSQFAGNTEPVDEILTKTRRSRWSLKRLLIVAAGLVFLALAGVFGGS
jgi:hypothetical protein